MKTEAWTGQHAADQWSADAVTWIHEAGNPYFDWLFNGPDTARSVIESRLQSHTSELLLRDAVLLIDESNDMLGGFIAMDGADLAARRKADAVAYLQAVRKEERPALIHRMQASRHLFCSPRPDEYYLSKLGVRRDARGHGHGRALATRFLSMGICRGFRRFALDVCEDNVRAIALYESLGFRVSAGTSVEGLRYLSMCTEQHQLRELLRKGLRPHGRQLVP